MNRRKLADTCVELSQIAYGMMRMRPKVDGLSATSLLDHLWDMGITTLHSSSEYDSYSLFVDALAKTARGSRSFEHIVKFASPSFDSSIFDAKHFTTGIDERLKQLDTDQITVLQWMIRTPDTSDSAAQVGVLEQFATDINETAAAVIEAGKVGAISIFAYSDEVASRAMELIEGGSITLYLNLRELPSSETLNRAKSILAMRPFGGDNLIVNEPAWEEFSSSVGVDRFGPTCLTFPLLHPKVSTVIASLNTESHRQVASTVADLEPDLANYQTWVATSRAEGMSN